MDVKCICCKGKGWVRGRFVYFPDWLTMNFVYLNAYVPCKDCNGAGWVDGGAREGYINSMETGELVKL